MGIRDESGEVLIGTPGGKFKARSFKRKPESQQWDYEAFSKMHGTPWEPIPGHEGREVKSSVNIHNAPIQPEVKVAHELKHVRRTKIPSSEVLRQGLTQG